MLGAKINYNKNEITQLSDAIKEQTEAYKAQDVDVSTLFYEGYSQYSIWAVQSLGIDPSTGVELYLDKDGNVTDTWAASDKVYCGTGDPKYTGNLTSMLRYKGFTLNLSFAYYWGGQTYNQTLIDKVEVSRQALMVQNVDRRVLTDRWMNPGDVTFFKGFYNSYDATNYATSRFVMDDNVFELSSASLQYRWDRSELLKKYNVQSVVLGVNMSDIFYLSSIKRERGTTYPYARQLGASLMLTF